MSMLNFSERVHLLKYFRDHFEWDHPEWHAVKGQARNQNPWFTVENIEQSFKAILHKLLDDETILKISEQYGAYCNPVEPKHVGVVMAGNIPMVGMHDVLCVFLSGHIALLKTSSKDSLLIPFVVNKLIEIDPRVGEHILFPDNLSDGEAYIATGSNNSVRYFEAYFGKYPSIIRKNRNSVAILDGSESDDDLIALGKDVFDYFGLGCRNVSKVYVPEGYTFDHLLDLWQEKYVEIILHNSYKNNYDYCYTMYLLNKMEFFMGGSILIVPDDRLSSRISMLHYERYQDMQSLLSNLSQQKENIQCTVGNTKFRDLLEVIPFGSTQEPGFFDYADGIDTMAFLNSLQDE